MRIFASALGGGITSLLVFSALWSTFVVQHHDYGGNSRVSQIFGAAVFFGYIIFPLILVPVLVSVVVLERAVIVKKKTERPELLRAVTWVTTCTLSTAALVGSVVPEHAVSAALCGLGAAIVGALVYERLAAVFPRMKEANSDARGNGPKRPRLILNVSRSEMRAWPFDQPKNCLAFTTTHVMNDGHDIIYAFHDEDDHGWQFHYDGEKKVADVMVVALEEIVRHDSSVLEVSDLPPGWKAWREKRGAPWQRAKNEGKG